MIFECPKCRDTISVRLTIPNKVGTFSLDIKGDILSLETRPRPETETKIFCYTCGNMEFSKELEDAARKIVIDAGMM